MRAVFGSTLRALARGKVDAEPWLGNSVYPVGPKFVGGQPKVRPGFTHFLNQKPQRPIRAIGLDKPLLPVLYNRAEQLVQIENALLVQRTELQVSVTLSELSVGIRNAEEFIQEHIFDREVRPSIHTLWFHERSGLGRHTHVLGTLAAHHLVPLFSLISIDVEKGSMTVYEAEELYNELMDCNTAQTSIVLREITNQMVRVYCLDGRPEEARLVIEEMQRRGIRRTFVTYAPLFRYLRAKNDVEGHMELLQFAYRIEGGRLQKIVLIDVPRWIYMLGVFIRHNWLFINVTFTALLTWVVLHYLNFGTELW